MIGVRKIGEQWFLEEYRSFNQVIPITNGTRISSGLRFPGAAPWYLKAMTRDTINAGVRVDRRFLFRFGNSAGDKWYTGAGVAVSTTELTLDTLIFGDGRFPYPVVPHPVFDRSATLTWEIQDISTVFPYDIFVSFIGSYLYPIAGPEEAIERLKLARQA